MAKLCPKRGKEYLSTLDSLTIIYMCNYIHLFVLDMFYININMYRKNEFVHGCYWKSIPFSHVEFFGGPDEFPQYYYEAYPDAICDLNSDELYYKFILNGKIAQSNFFHKCLDIDNEYDFSINLSLENIHWSKWDDSYLSW